MQVRAQQQVRYHKYMKQNKQSGIIAVMIVIAIAVVGVAGVGYFIITSGKTNTSLVKPYDGTTDVMVNASPSATVLPVSPSTDLNVIDSELNATVVQSVDADFDAMNESASSL